MSRASLRKQTPVVPPGGLTPMKAAEMFCPEAVAIYRQGGEALEVAIRSEAHRLSARAMRRPELRAAAWLTLQLLDVIYRRSDLKLTGRNPHASLGPRIAIDLDVLQAACERNNDDQAMHRRWVEIDFIRDLISSGRDLVTPFDLGEVDDRVDARIEASSASAVQPQPAPVETAEAVKPAYTPDRGKEWLTWVRETYLANGDPMPPTMACLAAANNHFSGPITRDPFYELHKEVAGADHKSGRRSSRKSARATAERLKNIKPPQ